jgi:hypothetical protein
VQALILRAAALVSDADDELTKIAETTEEIESAYAQDVEQGELEGELDVSRLMVYLRDSETVAQLVSAAETAGMQHHSNWAVSERSLWLVHRCGFESLLELDAFLQRSHSRAPDIFRQLSELVQREDEFMPWASPDSLVDWMLLVLIRADAELVELARYRPSIESALNVLIGNHVER